MTTKLVLRTCNLDHTSYNGFKWPSEPGSVVTAPDWSPDPHCGHGLHGLVEGKGSWALLTWAGIWQVVEVETKDLVELHDNGQTKVKFPKCILRYSGTREGAMTLMKLSLRGADLYGADLSGAYLRGADLSGADLSGADLRRADLRRADLSGAYLSGADLSGAYLSGADLSGAGLSEAVLSGANLYGADLSGANLSGAVLRGADLHGAVLRGANLSGANLSGARATTAPEGWLLENGVLRRA